MAYNFYSECWSPNHKDSGPLKETRNTCSIPDDSPAANNYFEAISRWNANSDIAVTASYANSDCTIDLDDWNNEIALVSRSQIDGANGKTSFAHVNACLAEMGGTGNYGATDIRLANDLDFSYRAPSDLYPTTEEGIGTGRGTIIHEIGHQLGLGHASGFNMLAPGTDGPRPSSPIGPVPFPDDINGVSVLYGTKPVTNVFASGQRWSTASSQVVNNHEVTEVACMGASFTVNVTVVNQGNEAATYAQQILLDNDADGSSPATVFSWIGATTARYDYSTFTFSISTDGLMPGDYYLLHAVDTQNQLSEAREDDNILLYSGQVIVSDCNNLFPALSEISLLLL